MEMNQWKKREECQKFRHYGLQRSGTNILEAILYRYFEVWCRNGGSGYRWKHSLEVQKELDEDIAFHLVISKNPYLWVESIAFRNPRDYIARQRKYPATDYSNIDSELIAGKNRINVVNAAKTWNEFYSNWFYHPQQYKIMFIRYEDLLIPEKQRLILEDIQRRFNCEWRGNPQSYKSAETTILRPQDEKKNNYYLGGRPSQLTDKQIRAISAELDENMVRSGAFRYEILRRINNINDSLRLRQTC